MAGATEQATREKSSFPYAQLLAKDFDGTVALTFEKSPAGIDVDQAYQASVEMVFGAAGLQTYLANGGLHNRAPIEVVRDLAPDATTQELAELTRKLNSAKLGILLGEIGTRFADGTIWPRPTPGYIELLEQIEVAQSNGSPIDSLILSSGHEPFIQKTYEAWSVHQPDHIVAVETIGRLALNVPKENLVKPSPILMAVARDMWRRSYGINRFAPADPDELKRILYVGDDPLKDGELAKNARVDFMLIRDAASSLTTWRRVAKRFGLGMPKVAGENE